MCVHFYLAFFCRTDHLLSSFVLFVLCKTFAFYNSLHIQFGWVDNKEGRRRRQDEDEDEEKDEDEGQMVWRWPQGHPKSKQTAKVQSILIRI